MEKLNETEALDVVGGGITGTLINAFITTGKFIFSMGQSLGSGLRRIGSNNLCPLRYENVKNQRKIL